MIWLGICILFIAVSGFLFYASYSIASGVYLKAVCKLNTREKLVALTYDDGPEPDTTLPLLDVLKKYDAKATFFCIGQKAERHPDVIRRIVAEGHEIGNHSYTHESTFPLYGKKKMQADLLKTQQILEEISGKEIQLFRPPYGVTNPTIVSVIKEFGWRTIGWSLRSFDTQCKTADEALIRIKRKLKSGNIILLHDRMPFTAELTEKLLVYLKENGYKVVPIVF
ncbi:MAG: polysaccharide deacetylase family protein [Bacteroidia bacterium]|nr:polysaccharide deacetylase family protein [Bacteroidia bacterium]